MADPVEGIHYIFDRYAYLNTIMDDEGYEEDIEIDDPENPGQKKIVQQPLQIDSDTPEDKIKKILRLARALNHPDHAKGRKKKEEAKKISEVIGDCEKMIADPERKPHYDAKLAMFKEKKPHLVSGSGNAIIDPAAELVDVDGLLSDNVKDTRHLEDHLKGLMQYDENTVTLAKAVYEKAPDDMQTRRMYRDALTRKFQYIDFLEDIAWSKLGISNPQNKTDGQILHPDNYVEQVDRALEKKAQTHIDLSLDQRGDSARLGMSALPLLLSYNSAATGEEAPSTALLDPAQMNEILDRLKARAHENYQLRAEYVREVARQKQAVLQELVTLTPVTALNDHDTASPHYDFYLLFPAENETAERVVLRFALDVSTGNATHAETFLDSHITPADLQARGLTRNSFLVEYNPGLPSYVTEIVAATERTFQKFKNQFAQPQSNEPEAPHP